MGEHFLLPLTATMSGFSRSFKPHSYLSSYRRPTMPGRTLSASSEKSDDGGEHATISGQTTPTWLPNQPYRRYGTPPISHTVGSAPGTMSTRLAPTADSSTSEQVSTRCKWPDVSSRPPLPISSSPFVSSFVFPCTTLLLLQTVRGQP